MSAAAENMAPVLPHKNSGVAFVPLRKLEDRQLVANYTAVVSLDINCV